MHVGRNLLPFYGETGPVGAENRIRRVLQIRLGVIAQRLHHLLLVPAGDVAAGRAAEPSASPGIGCHSCGIVAQSRNRNRAGENGQVFLLLLGKSGGHGPQVSDGPAQLCLGEGETEAVAGLQQDALGLHQALAHGPVGGLPEVASLCVLQMRPSGHQGELHIGDGRAGEDAQMGSFLQMRENQPLPGPLQHIFAAAGVEYQAAARRKGLQKQVDLGVMAQGFKMPHAFHRRCDGLLIQNLSGFHREGDVEPLLNQAF